MPQQKYIIRDVLHGYIVFDDLDRDVINTAAVQRLRFVRQNDVAFFVYPSLNVSRFEHSLGVFHIAGHLAQSALNNCPKEKKKSYLDGLVSHLPGAIRSGINEPDSLFCRSAKWYGLLHDIGHLPFSHLSEYCLNARVADLYPKYQFEKLHEAAGAYLVCQNGELSSALQKDPAAAWIVKQLMKSKRSAFAELQPLKDIVDGEVDADRIDATARDGLLSGGEFGHYDIERLSRFATLFYDAEKQGWRVYLSTHATSAIESLLVERCKTYRWIHYHPKVVAFKNAFRHCFAHSVSNFNEWHASQYISDHGYLDDSYAIATIQGDPAGMVPTHVNLARRAILRRAKTATPLWKRRDGFRELSAQAAAGHQELEAKQAKGDLVLNELADSVLELEEKLNDGQPDGVHFLVCQTKLEPFARSKIDYKIGTYKVIDSRNKAILLTSESQMISALFDVVKMEPAIGVTVIRDPDDNQNGGLAERFANVAAQMLQRRIEV